MFADDLLLYMRHGDPHRALERLEGAVGSLTPWLRDLGLSISIPIAVLLSESNEPPLGLRRSLLGGRFILANATLRSDLLIPKLSLLFERSRVRRFRIHPTRCGLLLAYESMRGLLGMCFCTICPLHFDYAWSDLITPFTLDFETGREVKGAVEPAVEFDSLIGLCGTLLHLRMRFPSTVVFTDSLYALYHLRDGFFSARTSPYVYKILHLLSSIQEQDRAIGFAWIPSHSMIVANEQADYLARSATRLPFISSLLSTRTTGPGAASCGLTRVHCLAVVIILTKYQSGHASENCTYLHRYPFC